MLRIGAKYLLNKYKYKKIAIVDFDVHHFNGTQDIFYDNKNVLLAFQHINILIILEPVQKKKKGNLIIFVIYHSCWY